MSSELEGTWKEVAMAYSKYCHGVCLVGLRRAIALAEIVTGQPLNISLGHCAAMSVAGPASSLLYTETVILLTPCILLKFVCLNVTKLRGPCPLYLSKTWFIFILGSWSL